jgi:MFS family permease
VIRVKGVWILGLAILGLGGSIQGTLGYLPLYLREVGWTPATADSALATFHAFSMVFAIPIAGLSDRLGIRKAFLIVTALLVSVGIGLLSFAAGLMVWISVIMAGIFRDAFMAIFMTTITETEGIGPARTGTAVGLVMAFSGLGSFFAPLLGNSLADIDLSLPFVFWAALAAAAMVTFAFVKEGKGYRSGLVLEK